MLSPLRTLLIYMGTFGIAGIGILTLISTFSMPAQSYKRIETSQTASISIVELPYIEPQVETSRKPTIASAPATPKPQPGPASPPPKSPAIKDREAPATITRVSNPYPFAQQSFQNINERSRTALVNILCTSGNESLRPISGSGVIIDSRGVILTNSHIAQYVLLSQNPEINLSCTVRSGSPARPAWNAEVLYIPKIWIEKHATDITNSNPTGTGEYDYALLRITGSYDTRVPDFYKENYPALPLDTREAISFLNDPMLVIAYPAEFVGSTATQFDLHPVSSITPISELLTFDTNTVDLVALKGAAGAQGGSSGGPVVNSWGYVTGIITTTSEGATTAERELRAITISYINRDLMSQTGMGIIATLNADLQTMATNFKANHAPALTKLLMDQITKRLQH